MFHKTIEEFIEECSVGMFKLTDKKFAKAVIKLGLTEDTEEVLMQAMINVPEERGTFVRVADGWIFVEYVEPTYDASILLNRDGSIDMRMVNCLAD